MLYECIKRTERTTVTVDKCLGGIDILYQFILIWIDFYQSLWYVNLFIQGRPKKFDSEVDEATWDSTRQNQVEVLRRKIESGEFVPEEIWAKEENKAAGTDDKAANDKQISIRQEKVQSFKINLKLYSLILVLFSV